MAPDTPERFLSAISARCTRQDQTRFDGSAERIFQRARLRASPLAPENLLRTVGRRFKRRGSWPQFVTSSADGWPASPSDRRRPRRTCRRATSAPASGVDRVGLGLAAVDRLQVQRVAEHEGNALGRAQVGEPVPGEHALAADDEAVAVGRERRQEPFGFRRQRRFATRSRRRNRGRTATWFWRADRRRSRIGAGRV